VEHASVAGLDIAAGLHTEECETATGPGISGVAVDAPGAIANSAQSGQVVVSHTVRDLVAGANFPFEECGSIALGPGLPEVRLLTVA
jgi:hypothetical protein